MSIFETKAQRVTRLSLLKSEKMLNVCEKYQDFYECVKSKRNLYDCVQAIEHIRESFSDLYDSMMVMPGLKEVMVCNNIRKSDLFDICTILDTVVKVEDGEYIPVTLVSFAEPLKYLFDRRTELKTGTKDQLRQIAKEAKKTLRW